MRLFSPRRRPTDPVAARTWAWFEIAYTGIDFTAAMLFITGSVLFLDEETRHYGTWLFLIGSVFFAAKPTLRLVREIYFLRRGDDTVLARRVESDLEIGSDTDRPRQ